MRAITKAMAITLAALSLVIASCTSNEKKVMEQLSKNGELQCGVITDVDSITGNVKYEFLVNQKTYKGDFSNDDPKKKYQKGDLLVVAYLRTNPKVNRRLNW